MTVLDRAYENQIKINRTWVKMPNGARNLTQIFREQFVYRCDQSDLKEKSEAAREKIRAKIENVLVHGVPETFGAGSHSQWATLGGVRHWLGRDLEAGDEVAIAVLYPLTLKVGVGEFDVVNDRTQHGEWITEVSLWVKAAPADDEKE